MYSPIFLSDVEIRLDLVDDSALPLVELGSSTLSCGDVYDEPLLMLFLYNPI